MVLDYMTPIRVACSHSEWLQVVALAHHIFPSEIEIMHYIVANEVVFSRA